MEEPLIEMDDLMNKLQQGIDAIRLTLNELHAKLGITDDEKMTMLSFIISDISITRMFRYYDLDPSKIQEYYSKAE
jgi:hypothetical protein